MIISKIHLRTLMHLKPSFRRYIVSISKICGEGILDKTVLVLSIKIWPDQSQQLTLLILGMSSHRARGTKENEEQRRWPDWSSSQTESGTGLCYLTPKQEAVIPQLKWNEVEWLKFLILISTLCTPECCTLPRHYFFINYQFLSLSILCFSWLLLSSNSTCVQLVSVSGIHRL